MHITFISFYPIFQIRLKVSVMTTKVYVVESTCGRKFYPIKNYITENGHTHYLAKRLECRYTMIALESVRYEAKLHLGPNFHITYVPILEFEDGHPFNYYHTILTSFKDFFIEVDFLDTLAHAIRKTVKNEEYEEVDGYIICDTCLITKYKNEYMFSKSLIEYAVDTSLAKPYIENSKLIPLLSKNKHKHEFSIYTKNWLGITVKCLRNEYEYSGRELLDTICNAVEKSRIWEVYTIFALLVKLHIDCNMLGAGFGIYIAFIDGNLKWDASTVVPYKVHKPELYANYKYAVTSEFFLRGFSYCKFYLRWPPIAEGHPYHPMNNMFMFLYYSCLELEIEPTKILINPKTLYWQQNVVTDIAYMSDFPDKSGKILKELKTYDLGFDKFGITMPGYLEPNFQFVVTPTLVYLKFNKKYFGTDAILLPRELNKPCKEKHLIAECVNCWYNADMQFDKIQETEYFYSMKFESYLRHKFAILPLRKPKSANKLSKFVKNKKRGNYQLNYPIQYNT
jgi:hypothetical protein